MGLSNVLPVPDVDVELLRLQRVDEVREAGGLDLRHLLEGHPALEGGALQPRRLYRQT